MPTKLGEIAGCSMTRPCKYGLAMRPRRLFGFSAEPVDEAPCFFTGSITPGGCGLPSTDSLAGLVSAGKGKIQGGGAKRPSSSWMGGAIAHASMKQIRDWLLVAEKDPPRYFTLDDAEAAIPRTAYEQLVEDIKEYDAIWWGCRQMLHDLEYKSEPTAEYYKLWKRARSLCQRARGTEQPVIVDEQGRRRARDEADRLAQDALLIYFGLPEVVQRHFDERIQLPYPRDPLGGDRFRLVPLLKSILTYFPETPGKDGTAMQKLIKLALKAELHRRSSTKEE